MAKCPSCSNAIRENLFGYSCMSCKFRLNKEMYGAYLLRSSVQDFIDNAGMKDVTLAFRGGSSFHGKLELDEDFKVKAFKKLESGDYEPLKSKNTKDLQDEETVIFEKVIESGFMEQSGKFKQTKEAYYFEINDYPSVLGKSTGNFESSPFIARLPIEICKRLISVNEAYEFFLNGKTNLLDQFISKRGKPFKAKLFIKY